MPTSPDPTTLKRLYVVSRNQCAFPGCTQPLMDPESGSVIGMVCHITAQNPGGPRYDPSQTDKERHAFDNLLMLCPTHHHIVDAKENVSTYTVAVLRKIKADHELVQGQAQLQMQDKIRANDLVLLSHLADNFPARVVTKYLNDLERSLIADPESDRFLFDSVSRSSTSMRFSSDTLETAKAEFLQALRKLLDLVDEHFDDMGEPPRVRLKFMAHRHRKAGPNYSSEYEKNRQDFLHSLNQVKQAWTGLIMTARQIAPDFFWD